DPAAGRALREGRITGWRLQDGDAASDGMEDVRRADEGLEGIASRRISDRIARRPEGQINEVPLIVARVGRVELVGFLDLGLSPALRDGAKPGTGPDVIGTARNPGQGNR